MVCIVPSKPRREIYAFVTGSRRTLPASTLGASVAGRGTVTRTGYIVDQESRASVDSGALRGVADLLTAAGFSGVRVVDMDEGFCAHAMKP